MSEDLLQSLFPTDEEANPEVPEAQFEWPTHWCKSCGQGLPKKRSEDENVLERRLQWLAKKQSELEKQLEENLLEQERTRKRIKSLILKKMPKD